MIEPRGLRSVLGSVSGGCRKKGSTYIPWPFSADLLFWFDSAADNLTRQEVALCSTGPVCPRGRSRYSESAIDMHCYIPLSQDSEEGICSAEGMIKRHDDPPMGYPTSNGYNGLFLLSTVSAREFGWVRLSDRHWRLSLALVKMGSSSPGLISAVPWNGC